MIKVFYFLLHLILCKGQAYDSFRVSEDSATSASSSSRALGSRIIGGYGADPKKYPFFAWLNIQLDSEDTAFCGGTLIAPDVIMTAAHCVEYYSAIDVWVNSTTRKASDYEYFRKSVRTIIHPKYKKNKPEDGNDIALIFLDSPVKEVPLVTRSKNVSLPGNTRTLVTAIGFGRTKSSSGGSPFAPTPTAFGPFSRPPPFASTPTVTGPFSRPAPYASAPVRAATAGVPNPHSSVLVAPSSSPPGSKPATNPVHERNLNHDDDFVSNPYPEKLMEVKFFSIPKNECIKKIGSWKAHEYEICASEGKKGVCYGDSGGPLFIKKGSGFVQIGISVRGSSTYECVGSNMPQFFTNVAYFTKWLDEKICKYSKRKPSTCRTSKPSRGKPSAKSGNAKP